MHKHLLYSQKNSIVLNMIELAQGQFPINPFVHNAPFLYPLRTSENLMVLRCFQRVEKGCIGNKWAKKSLPWNLNEATEIKQ